MDENEPRAAERADPGRYRSYLLRLWREAPSAPWRCQVQCVGSGQVRRFAGLASLFEFLSADTAGGDPPYDEERDRREPHESLSLGRGKEGSTTEVNR